jgi:hypothetical protein
MGSPCGRLTRHSLELNGVATFGAHELRPGRVLPLPRDGGVLPTGQNPPVGACRFPAASPAPRYSIPSVGALRDEASGSSLMFTLSVFPLPVAPDGKGSWAYPRASHLAVTHDARRGGDEPWTLARDYTFDISRSSYRCFHS